jgi:hypothetical protein
MNKVDFVSALQHFTNSADMSLVPAGTNSFELRLREDPSSRRVFVKLETGSGSTLVSEILFRCLCGTINNPDALPGILSKNFGGVMGTEFFFSARVIEGKHCLFLETRAYVDPDSDDRDEVTGIIMNLMMSPILTMEWDFPQGVKNLLW